MLLNFRSGKTTWTLSKRTLDRMGASHIGYRYHYVNMWKPGQYTDFMRHDYVSIPEAVEAFIDGHSRYWGTFLQNKDRRRCPCCFEPMDFTTLIASEPALLFIVRLCAPRYNRNGSVVLDSTVDFGGFPYHLFCVLYTSSSRYHEYYPNVGTHTNEEYNNVKKGAEVLIYHITH